MLTGLSGLRPRAWQPCKELARAHQRRPRYRQIQPFFCRSANTSGKSCVFYMFPAGICTADQAAPVRSVSVFHPQPAHFGERTCSSSGAHSHRKTRYRDDRLHPNDELYQISNSSPGGVTRCADARTRSCALPSRSISRRFSSVHASTKRQPSRVKGVGAHCGRRAVLRGDRQMTYRIAARAVKSAPMAPQTRLAYSIWKRLRQIEASQAMLSSRPTGRFRHMRNRNGGYTSALAEFRVLQRQSGFSAAPHVHTGHDYARAGADFGRSEMTCRFLFSNLDAYLNVVGGLHVDEPAVDRPLRGTRISRKDTPIRDDTVVFGEIGLAGELAIGQSYRVPRFGSISTGIHAL